MVRWTVAASFYSRTFTSLYLDLILVLMQPLLVLAN
jgi:hypothetical protein